MQNAFELNDTLKRFIPKLQETKYIMQLKWLVYFQEMKTIKIPVLQGVKGLKLNINAQIWLIESPTSKNVLYAVNYVKIFLHISLNSTKSKKDKN